MAKSFWDKLNDLKGKGTKAVKTTTKVVEKEVKKAAG